MFCCRDDDQIQSRDVREDEGQEEQGLLQHREEDGVGRGERRLCHPSCYRC